MMNSYKVTATKQRLDLLMEIEQTPEEFIPELLNFVRLFREGLITKQTSVNAWNNDIHQINNSDQNPEKFKKLVTKIVELNRNLTICRITLEKDQLKRQIDATDREIDKLVYQLYDLTEDEIKIIEESV